LASAVEDDLSVRLNGGQEAPARARRALASLRTDLDTPTMETLRLLVTELVGNSVKHAAAASVILNVRVDSEVVLTEVTDEGNGFRPATAGARRADDTGWGLFLVERLADRWGVVREGQTTRVWFELSRA
jgi:anti-sigma regulatory factor (Ser/Thr protein kinase)